MQFGYWFQAGLQRSHGDDGGCVKPLCGLGLRDALSVAKGSGVRAPAFWLRS